MEQFLFEKERLWLYILCLLVLSVTPIYCLIVGFYAGSVYNVFFCWQFYYRGHVSSSLHLHCLLDCVLLWRVSIFVVAFYDLRYVTCTTIADLHIGGYDRGSVCILDL